MLIWLPEGNTFSFPLGAPGVLMHLILCFDRAKTDGMLFRYQRREEAALRALWLDRWTHDEPK